MRVNELRVWRALERDSVRLRESRIEELLDEDPHRLATLAIEASCIYVDLSKNLIDGPALNNLLNLASERSLPRAIEALFNGEIVNATENRPALHTLLRAELTDSTDPAQTSRMEQIAAVRRQLGDFTERLSTGAIAGHDGAAIRDVVNIGIGGSHLGPCLVCDALRYDRQNLINVHFVSNVDGGALGRVLESLDPASTYFIIASKSFTTAETLLNAQSAKLWIQKRFGDDDATLSHFSAVTARPDRAEEFGIDPENIFPMWDWVGGRYSLWSAIGLPICIAIGVDGFDRLLAGARSMDQHFRTAELSQNLPVMLGLIGIWNNNFLDCDTRAVVPYDDRLEQLPAYLQQLEMESNGKRVTLTNDTTSYATAPVVWGGVGTNAQHAFFQQLHQGTQSTPVDFIIALTHQRATNDHHDMLVANCFAQAQGLMQGRNRDVVGDIENPDSGLDLATHRESPGNRPSTMIALDALTPESLGALLALYEHKTYVEGTIWGINPFDQWGVELGKTLASAILTDFIGVTDTAHDQSTQALITRFSRLRKP